MCRVTRTTKSDLETLVAATIAGYAPVTAPWLGIGDAAGEQRYLANSQSSYVKTLAAIVSWRPPSADVRVLEIGSFLGALCIALSKCGYQVSATDIPEFTPRGNMLAKLNEHHIEFRASNLRDYTLPYPDETFDVVIMCQVLEHLNFNPLPVIQEINRVCKPNGLLYLALPNLASLNNRIALLQGKSIHNSISDLFLQLMPDKNFVVGLHWREYTGTEVKEMLERLGFHVERQEYDYEVSDTLGVALAVTRVFRSRVNIRQLPGKAWRYLKKRAWTIIGNLLMRFFPRLRGNITTLAVKVQASHQAFYFTDATRPT